MKDFTAKIKQEKDVQRWEVREQKRARENLNTKSKNERREKMDREGNY